MGGSWDATNLVAGDVAVIGEIGLDHPELGSSVQEVATEKAGIVKSGKIVVVREQPDEALKVIEARASDVGATLLLEGRDWEVTARLPAVGGQQFRVQGVHATYDELFIPMFGEHVVRNVAAAIVAVESFLGYRLDEDATRSAIGALRIPGRLEVVARSPLVVLDGAHNPAGAEALARALVEAFTWSRLHVVLAVSSNKDLDGVVAALAPMADVWYPAQNESVRSFPAGARRGADRGRRRPRRGPGNRGGIARGGPRRGRRRRPHPGDGLSLHCRGRPTGAGRILSSWSRRSTLLIIKPDGVRRRLIGEVLRRVEEAGLTIDELRMETIDRATAEEQYGEHRDKPFFAELVDFITGGPVVVAKVTGDDAISVWRDLMGPTDPADAPPGTIRGDFASVITENVVHGSDSPESAARELKLFFGE